MAKAKKMVKKVCENGHTFYKSSDCPTCPNCEAERIPKENFLSLLAAPARRALENKGIISLQKLSEYSEQEILQLHGMGKTTIPKLRLLLTKEDLNFKKIESWAKQNINFNPDVSFFLDEQNHPLRKEIQLLRQFILSANINLLENIKWNGPNYCMDKEDRITIKIQPPKNIQIIFHCGAKVKEQPKEKLIKEDFGLLAWKGNDRAIATFKSILEIEKCKETLSAIINEWLNATK
jgi:Domain of unknown function (DU1801)